MSLFDAFSILGTLASLFGVYYSWAARKAVTRLGNAMRVQIDMREVLRRLRSENKNLATQFRHNSPNLSTLHTIGGHLRTIAQLSKTHAPRAQALAQRLGALTAENLNRRAHPLHAEVAALITELSNDLQRQSTENALGSQ